MKKAVYIVSTILLCALIGCAQNSTVKKPEAPQTDGALQMPTPQREKFNPQANPNADLQAAIQQAQKENKRIVLDVGGEWCVWCREMDGFLIRNKDLGKLRDENFVWVKINFSEENENKEFLAAYPAVKGYPHLFVLDKDGKLLLSKDTSELEDGKKSYNLEKFTAFLNEYAPGSNKTTTDVRRPEITIDEALDTARKYLMQSKIDVSEKYIDAVQLNLNPRGDRGKYWRLTWQSNEFTKGGYLFMDVYMDKSMQVTVGK